MTGLSFAFDGALHSGACVAVPRHVARAADLMRRAVQSRTEIVAKDYCLSDAQGYRLGTVPAALVVPAVGPSAPTIYLRRDV